MTSPLTITQAMDGSTLTIMASATNFEDASTTIVLSYIETSKSLLAISKGSADASGWEGIAFGFASLDTLGDAYLDENTAKNGFARIATLGSNVNVTEQEDFGFICSTSGTCYLKYMYSATMENGGFVLGTPAPASGTWKNQISATCVVWDMTANTSVLTVTKSHTSASGGGSASNAGSFSAVAGHTYTLIINATIESR